MEKTIFQLDAICWLLISIIGLLLTISVNAVIIKRELKQLNSKEYVIVVRHQTDESHE